MDTSGDCKIPGLQGNQGRETGYTQIVSRESGVFEIQAKTTVENTLPLYSYLVARCCVCNYWIVRIVSLLHYFHLIDCMDLHQVSIQHVSTIGESPDSNHHAHLSLSSVIGLYM